MRHACRPQPPFGLAAGLICSAFLAGAAEARDGEGGSIAGRVESSAGLPVEGAVISVYGAGQGSFVAVSDMEGRFSVDLPPGRYTVRTLAGGFLPPTARRVWVAAQRELSLDLRFDVAGAAASLAASRVDKERVKELRWLIRHKRRSVLEDHDARSDADEAATSRRAAAPVEGSCWILAGPGTPRADGDTDDDAAGASAVAVGGALPGGHWSAGGVLPDGDAPAWRAAAELNMSSGRSHGWRAASSYAGREGIGSLLTEGRWQIASGVAATAGLRYTYRAGDGEDVVDPTAAVEVAHLPGGGRLRVRTLGGVTVAGGDPFQAAGHPVGALVSSGMTFSARRQRRHDATLERSWGRALVAVHAFAESSEAVRQWSSVPAALEAQGGGMRLGACVGTSVRATATYSCGRKESLSTETPASPIFHELVTEVEARVRRSDTRVSAYYRVHRGARDETVSRFDVQLHQGLPFLQGVARSRWELLFAVRNLVYESTEPGSLDDLAIETAPARVVGGVSVQF